MVKMRFILDSSYNNFSFDLPEIILSFLLLEIVTPFPGAHFVAADTHSNPFPVAEVVETPHSPLRRTFLGAFGLPADHVHRYPGTE